MTLKISTPSGSFIDIQNCLKSVGEQPRSTPEQVLKIIRELGKFFSSIQDACVKKQPGCELALSEFFAVNWQSFLSDSNFQTPNERYYFVHQFLQNFPPENNSFSCGLLEALLIQPTILDPSMRPLSKQLVPLFWNRNWAAINDIMELYKDEANDQEINIWLIALIFTNPSPLNTFEGMKESIRRLPAYSHLHTEEIYLEQLTQMFSNEYEKAVAAFNPESGSKIKLSMAYLILTKNKSLKKIPKSIFLIHSVYENALKEITKKGLSSNPKQTNPIINYFEKILNDVNLVFDHSHFCCSYLKQFEEKNEFDFLRNMWLHSTLYLKEKESNPKISTCFQFIEESVGQQIQYECYLSVTLLMFACRVHLNKTFFFKKDSALDLDTVRMIFQSKWALASIYLEKQSSKNMRSFDLWVFCQSQLHNWLKQFKTSKVKGALLISFAKDNPNLRQEIFYVQTEVSAFLVKGSGSLPNQLNFLKTATSCMHKTLPLHPDPLAYPLWLKNLLLLIHSKQDITLEKKNSYLRAIQDAIVSYEGEDDDVLALKKREGEPLSSTQNKKLSI